MPYATRKVRGKNCYKVYNKKTKKVFSRCASKDNAEKQMKLLRAIEFNKDFVPRAAMKKMGGNKSKSKSKKNFTYKKSKR